MRDDRDYTPAVTVRSLDGKTIGLSNKDLRNAAIDARKNAENRLKKGDEVFICFKWNRRKPDDWNDCVVVQASQTYFKVSRNVRRFRQSDMQTSDKQYIAFVPTPEERIQWAEHRRRSELTSEILRQDWGKLSIEHLERIVAAIKQAP